MKDLNYYINAFLTLNTMRKCGKPAPHKALLLLSIIDLIEQNKITDCRIVLNDNLVKQFRDNTSILLNDSILFQPKVNYPYYHMRSEPFWKLVSHSDEPIEEIGNYSITNLRKHIAYARIDNELFELIKEPEAKIKLRVALISEYLGDQPTLADNLPLILFTFGTLANLIA